MTRVLTAEEVTRQLEQLAAWEQPADTVEIRATYTFDDFAGSLRFVNAVGELAEAMNHHPDIDIRWNTVLLTLSTHSEGGLTQNDIELAHQIDREA